jgi:hypothetical protein
LAEKFVNDMCDHDFIGGWFGDVSDKFKRSQIDIMKRLFKRDGVMKTHINYLTGDVCNLLKYCGWTIDQAKEYICACGYTPVDNMARKRPGISIKEDDTGNVYTKAGVWNPAW